MDLTTRISVLIDHNCAHLMSLSFLILKMTAPFLWICKKLNKSQVLYEIHQFLALFFSSPYLQHISSLSIRFYYDWLLQAISVAYYYVIGLTLGIFFIGISFYVRAMVMDLKRQLKDFHNLWSIAAKYSCLMDAFSFHSEVLKLVSSFFGIFSLRNYFLFVLIFF